MILSIDGTDPVTVNVQCAASMCQQPELQDSSVQRDYQSKGHMDTERCRWTGAHMEPEV